MFTHAADYDRLELQSMLFSVVCDPSEDLAVQSDAIDADINTLVKRFGLTVDSPENPGNLAFYGDFSGVVDFHTAQTALVDARNAFESLPSRVRERFVNDPRYLLQFLENPANAREAAEMGLLTPEAAEAILKPPTPTPEPVKGGEPELE